MVGRLHAALAVLLLGCGDIRPGELIVGGQAAPAFLTIADDTLYFAARGSSDPSGRVYPAAIRSVPLAGGEVTTLVAAPQASAEDMRQVGALAVDATHVYFAWSAPNVSGSGTVERVPRQGGPSEIVYSFSPGIASGLALTEDELFVAHGKPDGRVVRVPKTGGFGEILLESETEPFVITVFGDALYAANGDRTFQRVDLVSGAVERLGLGPPTPWVLVADATHVYSGGGEMFAEGANGEIRRIAIDGTNPYLYTRGGRITDLRIDAPWIYFSDLSYGISRVPIDGGRAEVLADDLPLPWSIAVYGSSLYCSILGGQPYDDGEIRRLDLP